MKRCHECGRPVDRPVGFDAVCDGCSAYLHACKNCQLHNPSLSNGCESSTTDPVRDPAGKNFCEEFDFVESSGEGTNAADRDDTSKKARDAFDRLFGD
jgi:hypothetical protein